MPDNNIIITEFQRIKNLGFIPSKRLHNTGIGKTFEDYLGVDENNHRSPDFEGFEVKSQRLKSSSYVTLFTKSPNGPKNANTILRDTYGKPDPKSKGFKKLHTSIFGNSFNTCYNKYCFKLQVDRKNQKVIIVVKDLSSDTILDNSVYWSFDELTSIFTNKIKNLFFVQAETRTSNGTEEFHYTNAIIYKNPSFENFLNLIETGYIMVDIRIGSYKSGIQLGKVHDHGTGFRIKGGDFLRLYEDHFNV